MRGRRFHCFCLPPGHCTHRAHTAHYTHCTVHTTVHTHCTLQCKVYNAHTPHTAHCFCLPPGHCTLQAVHETHCKLQTKHCTLLLSPTRTHTALHQALLLQLQHHVHMSVAVKYFAEHWTETSSAKYSLQFSFMPSLSLSLFTSLSHLKLGAKWF